MDVAARGLRLSLISGAGQQNTEDRLEALDGSVEMISSLGRGTTIACLGRLRDSGSLSGDQRSQSDNPGKSTERSAAPHTRARMRYR